MTQIRINKNLLQFSLLLLFLSGIFIVIANKFSPFLSHLTYYCQSFLNASSIAIPQFVTLLPFVLLFSIVLFSFGKVLILYLNVKHLKRKLQGELVVHHKIEKLVVQLGLTKKVNIIHIQDKFAFCLGIKNPQIYVSTGLVSELTKEELTAVLKHEEYHLNNHDSFTMLLASVSHSLFPFFPLIGDLINKYRIEREIQADVYATNSVGNATYLVSALKKLLAYTTSRNLAYSAIADEETLEPRINSLLNKQYLMKPFRMRNIVVTGISFIAVSFIVVVPVYATELHHDHYDIMVLSSETSTINSCIAAK